MAARPMLGAALGFGAALFAPNALAQDVTGGVASADAVVAIERSTKPTPRAQLGEAIALDERGEFTEAIARLRLLVDSDDPSVASVAQSRLAWLEARSEDGFGPLSALRRVQRSYALTTDPGALHSLLLQARSFVTGRVQVETYLFVGYACERASCSEDRALAARLVLTHPFSSANERSIAHAMIRSSSTTRDETSDAQPVIVGDRENLVGRAHRLAHTLTIASACVMAVASFALGLAVVRRRAITDLTRGLVRVSVTCALIAAMGVSARLYEPTLSSRPFVWLAGLFLLLDRAMVALAMITSSFSRRWPRGWLFSRLVFALVASMAVAVLSLAGSEDDLLERIILREPR